MKTSAPILGRLAGWLRFAMNYGNPFPIAMARLFRRRGVMVVCDRASGVQCACLPEARRMFGEVWHDRDYDVPHLTLSAGENVLDIGANQGFYACRMAWKGLRVHAFEPAPENFRLLEENVRRNRFEKLVKAAPCAVGGCSRKVELMISDAMGGGMNTISPGFAQGAGLAVRERLTVDCVTLDEVLSRFALERVRVCKLDCEGSELDILRAASPETRAAIDAFVIEYHPEAYPVAELVALLMSWGTHQVSFAEDKWCPRHIIRAVSNSVLT